MISVENFYQVLYANLLRPAGLDCFYYYPFGTTHNLSRDGEFHVSVPKYDHHALFHFDQEPLIDQSLGTLYDTCVVAQSNKIIKLLANSEHSTIKREICRQRGMLDWYFFYHGFAAHDWFRDARYFPDMHAPQKIFNSFNHNVTHRRSYRMSLTARLIEHDVLQQGDVSFHGNRQDCEQEVSDTHSELSDTAKKLIVANLIHHARPLPMTLDHAQIDASFSAKFGHQEYRLWQNSLVHVVNETVFYESKLHLTEKVFKPIVALRPFILVAAPGNLAYLKSYGFQTFDAWIDEGYDAIQDPDARLEAVANEIKRLCQMTPSSMRDMHKDMMSVLVYNKNHFFTTFHERIVDELVDNFDACLRIWNNGRINVDRVIARNYNVDLVKQRLKQWVIADI